MYRAGLVVFIFLSAVLPVLAETIPDSRHVLKGRIIRSLAVEADNAQHILAGQKAGKPGSALVFQSTDGGKTWRTLNGNRPLAPRATDVQAVAALSANVLLAGTWKHGLFVSRDGGKHFVRIADFPSSDIRDLQIEGGVIYAATARHGVFASRDKARTWQALGPGKDFLWSLTASRSALFASSLEQAVHTRRDGQWQKVFDLDKAYAIATGPERPQLRAIAGETALYVSTGKGWQKFLDGEKFADVLILNDSHIAAASWSNGIAVTSIGGALQKRLLEGNAIVHLQVAGSYVLAATWGRGLHIIPMMQILR